MTPALGYSEMKDSGTVWLGEIPSDWAISKIGSLYTQRNEKVSDKDYPPLSVTMKGILPQLDTAAKTEDGDNRKLVKIGDFAINSRSDRRGSCGISPYDGSVSLINTILTPRNAMHPGYYNWLFHTSLFADEFYKWGHGIVDDLWTTRWQEMKKIIVPVPSYSIQEQISAYLDTQCAKIDEIIAEAKTSIEDYKKWKASIIYEAVTKGLDPDVEMKETGVSWLGMVPSDWNVTRMKSVFQNVSIKNHPKEEVLSLYRDLGVVPKNSRDDNHNVTSEDTAQYKFVEKGDLVINKMKAWQGSLAVSDYSGIVSPAYYVCRFRSKNIDKRYIHYLLRCNAYAQEFERLSTGMRIGQWDLGIDDFLRVPVLLPDASEQAAIATYLDGQCGKIDELIAEKQSLISDLESYKKSLIYEVVTGKRCVPALSEATVVAVHPSVLAYQKALLMCRVLDLLGHDARGRIHVQKCLFAIECLLKTPFQTHYVRYEHGPYDTHITDCEALIAENDWFTIQNGSPVIYKKGAHFNAYLDEYMKVFADMDSKIKEIVEFLKPMKTSQAERIATLLAAWNDFILDGTAEPTDQQIVNEIMTNWTPNKANTQLLTWQNSMDKLKQSGFVPAGLGVHTIKKEAQEV